MYTLYQNEDGLWGVKDADGNIALEAAYKRVYGKDGNVYYTDKLYLEVLEFSPEDGFDIVAWQSAPWWDEGFAGYRYSKRYYEYVMKYCGDTEEPIQEMAEALSAFEDVEALNHHLDRLRNVALFEQDKIGMLHSDVPRKTAQQIYDTIGQYLADESYPLFARESLAYLTFLEILYTA